jgi:uracil-DNA glycosylase
VYKIEKGNYLKFTFTPLKMDVKIEQSWKDVLKNEFEKEYFIQLSAWLNAEKSAGKVIYPAGSMIFNAFEQTPFEQVKVVLIGQDPYHGAGQAHGLSFSVLPNTPLPPSLRNIFKELYHDTGVKTPIGYGDLTKWAKQGVLLLNATLTVRSGEPNSHAAFGWMNFTDAVIKLLSQKKQHVVFILWGKFAQEKQGLINEKKHTVLKSAHPSPFSADKGFFGCRHFSKVNQSLTQSGQDPIDWTL